MATLSPAPVTKSRRAESFAKEQEQKILRAAQVLRDVEGRLATLRIDQLANGAVRTIALAVIDLEHVRDLVLSFTGTNIE